MAYSMNRDYFNVLKKVDNKISFANLSTTFHYDSMRVERHNKIMKFIGDGTYLAAFVVDKGHPNGNEIHTIFDNGIILIQNERTGLVITELIARPAQIRRYWEGKSEPNYVRGVCAKAFIHQQNNWNLW